MSEVKTFLIKLSDRGQVLSQDAATIINQCQKITVTNDDQRSNLLELVKKIKSTHKGLEEERMSTTRPIDEVKKQIMDLYRAPIENLSKAEITIKKTVTTYDAEQRRKAEELQRKLQAKAEQDARKEREKLEAQAAKAVIAGKIEKAEALQERADEVQVFVPIVQTVAAKTAGVSTRKVWKYKITDVDKLPRAYMIPNEVMLAALARSTQGNIPVMGVEFYAEDSLSIRS